MPKTAMPEGKIVCIGGDGGGMKSHHQYFLLGFIRWVYNCTIDKPTDEETELTLAVLYS